MLAQAWLLATAVVAAQPAPNSDFDYFRDEIEPIFLEKRDGHARCVACHQHRAQFHLQPLSEGATSWTEEQSRRNYASARRLVTPGEPSSSRLLTMPLSEEAGGDPFHPGGKHWENRDDPTWQKLAEWVRRAEGPEAQALSGGLDFDFFRSRVQPILAKKRDGHARCVACHQHRAQFPLRPLEGGSGWSDADTRRNFAAASRLVVPGDPDASRLLRMPLSEEAGGEPFHPGGKHWESKSDPDYQTFASWVRGER